MLISKKIRLEVSPQLDKIRSKRDRCKKGSRRYKHLSQVYKRVSQQKRNKQNDSLHKASHLIAHKLVERTVVVGDVSQTSATPQSSVVAVVICRPCHCGREPTVARNVDSSWIETTIAPS